MTSKTTNKFSPEVRARVVPMVLDHEGKADVMANQRNVINAIATVVLVCAVAAAGTIARDALRSKDERETTVVIKKVYVYLADNFEGRFFMYEAPVPIGLDGPANEPTQEIHVRTEGDRFIVYFHADADGLGFKTDYFYRGKQIPIYPNYQHNGSGGGLSTETGRSTYGLPIGMFTMPLENEFCFSPPGSQRECWSKKDRSIPPSEEFIGEIINYYKFISKDESEYLEKIKK